MANSNDFLPFATGSGANILTPAQYAALTARSQGFVAGIAQSIEANTVWRQATFVAAMIAQFTADYGPSDVHDDGVLANLEAQFISALQTFTITRVVYVSSTTTLTVASNEKRCRARGWGGGGGGGGCKGSTSAGGSTGGGGGFFDIYLTSLTAGQQIVCVIGAPGTGGNTSPSNGTAGGDTSFGSYATARGGAGGQLGNPNASSPSNGGTASVYSGTGFAQTGYDGGTPMLWTGGAACGGEGGASPFGGTGARPNQGGAGKVGFFPGGGGGGGTNNNAGGDGSVGYLEVTFYA